jgi:hypothetical protein
VERPGQLATLDQLTVSVTNDSSHSVRPSFTIDEGLTMTAFWRRVNGPPVLGSHQKARYTIQPRVSIVVPARRGQPG